MSLFNLPPKNVNTYSLNYDINNYRGKYVKLTHIFYKCITTTIIILVIFVKRFL